ncbi:hypothetical protein AB0D99_10585 [Streptomyces sp. NPDC047971]|uniref:hypothetical protein n=1 Tax=Streptomyces sp. NPDC047971 TaxID=3154499 RepID=UPI0033CE6447
MRAPVIVDTHAAHAATGTQPATVRKWIQRGHLIHYGYDRAGRALIDLHELEQRLAAQAA